MAKARAGTELGPQENEDTGNAQSKSGNAQRGNAVASEDPGLDDRHPYGQDCYQQSCEAAG